MKICAVDRIGACQRSMWQSYAIFMNKTYKCCCFFSYPLLFSCLMCWLHFFLISLFGMFFFATISREGLECYVYVKGCNRICFHKSFFCVTFALIYGLDQENVFFRDETSDFVIRITF